VIGTRAFFSFTELRDATLHRPYNDWHQLDHRPENLALDGVAYGERWVRSPDCVADHAPGTLLDPLQYLNMYWFREPVRAAVDEWAELAERSIHWGRRPDVGWANRLLMGFFLTVKGYAHPRVRVSPDVLPLRPNTGVYVTVDEIDEPASAAAETMYREFDEEHIPGALDVGGVAGAWTFTSDATLGTPALPPLPAGLRVHLYFVDGDPLAVAHELASRLPHYAGIARTLYRGPLRAITPWQWDWFEPARR
jgi:hypothetical protein